MRWINHGRIFDPTKWTLPSGCKQFAQSPQTLEFDDRIRIYFSTRNKEPCSGKYLSHIAYVDFDKAFREVIKISDKPIIQLGKLGCFDEHGIFPMSILRDGTLVRAYTCGWSRRVSVSVETGIGLAISNDNGETFKKCGEGPILSSSIHEPVLVGDPCVRIYDGIYHMWYIFGLRWISSSTNDVERIYKIGHATSADGTYWQKQEGKRIVDDRLNADECQALPTVLRINDCYGMFFCYREATDFRTNKARSYRLGYAYSKDLVHWIRDDEGSGFSPSKDSWNSEMQCYPHLCVSNSKVYLLYNGNEFGKYGFGLAELVQ